MENEITCILSPHKEVDDAGIHTFTDCFKGGETSFVVNLCAFVEENPVIGFRYACKETYGDTILVKGLDYRI